MQCECHGIPMKCMCHSLTKCVERAVSHDDIVERRPLCLCFLHYLRCFNSLSVCLSICLPVRWIPLVATCGVSGTRVEGIFLKKRKKERPLAFNLNECSTGKGRKGKRLKDWNQRPSQQCYSAWRRRYTCAARSRSAL